MVGVDDHPRSLLLSTESEADDGVRLSVRDAGVGLDPENVDKLFGAFFTTKSGGMGIGLFVSRSIIERHQGRLWAESNRDGPGTTFSFSIPRISDAHPGRSARSDAVVTDDPPLVSIVDDDVSVRESVPDLLRQLGYEAEAFPSAEAFLASGRVTETRCLLLDIAMPGMSGPDLQQELARRREQIPIVYITGSGDRAVRPRLLARGAVECLFKPFSEAELLGALDAALRTRTDRAG